jgi:hypothetical protein
MVAEPEPFPRAAKPLPPRALALITQLNTNIAIVTDADLERLQIRGIDTFSRIGCLTCCRSLKAAIIEQAQAAFPDAPASQAALLRWHLRGLNLELSIRKAQLAAQIEVRKTARSSTA